MPTKRTKTKSSLEQGHVLEISKSYFNDVGVFATHPFEGDLFLSKFRAYKDSLRVAFSYQKKKKKKESLTYSVLSLQGLIFLT